MDEKVLRALLNAVPEIDRLAALKSHNVLGTALHCAASRQQNNIVLCILTSMSSENVFSIVKIHKDDGSTIMHTCFTDDNIEVLDKIFKLVSLDQAIKLLSMKDTAELTCIDYAVIKEHNATLKLMLEMVSIEKLLQEGLLRTADGKPLANRKYSCVEMMSTLLGRNEGRALTRPNDLFII